jgi:hypothetical protein
MGQWEGQRVGRVGEIVAPAITGINIPRRRRWKCLCQCRARPEIIIMGEPQVQFPIIGTIIYLLCALCAHNTSPSLSASPILASCCWQGRPSGSHMLLRCCGHGRLAVSPSRRLAQAAWSWKACSGSLKEGQGANGRPRAAKGAHPADSQQPSPPVPPVPPVPPCPLSPPLSSCACLPTLSCLSQVTEARR